MPKARQKQDDSDRTIDADAEPDEVSRALGLGDADDEPEDDEPDTEHDDDDTDDGDDGDDDEDDEDEDPLEALRAELREQRRTIARLTREAAAARVRSKTEASQGGTGQGSGSDELTVEQAREQGREEARLEAATELAEQAVRTALVGIIPEGDLDSFVDDLRIERYLTDDGKVDRAAIKRLRERQAKITRRKTPAKVGHGRSGGAPAKRSKGELLDQTMSRLGL